MVTYILHFLPCRHVNEEQILMDFFLRSKRLYEKYKPKELAYNFPKG